MSKRRFQCAVLGALLVISAAPLSSQTVPSRSVQEGVISGTVIEAHTLKPIAGAQVVVTGIGSGTVTDGNGRFRISGLTGRDVTLHVVMLGFRDWVKPVTVGAANLRIELELRALELDELVITGTTGATQFRALGNSLGQVKAAALDEIAPVPNVHALLSSVTGVQISSSRGEIGAGSNIRIRGVSSMSLSSQPLIYIDGVRVNNNPADQGGGVGGIGMDGRSPPSRFDDINPDDIESIEVIKGPAAATLYGTEASNGVIQIITKKGHAGKPTFNLTIKQGANWLPNPDKLFPSVYDQISTGEIVEINMLKIGREIGFPVSLYGSCPAPYSQVGVDCKGTPFRTGNPQSYGGNVSGGGDGLKYYFSLDWDRDQGPVDYNWQNRLSGRANLNWTPSEKVSVDFGLGNTRSKLQSASPVAPVTVSILWACAAPGCERGTGLPNALDGPFRGYQSYLPERYENDVEAFAEVQRTMWNLSAKNQPFPWFNHRLALGGDFTDTNNAELYRSIVGSGSGVGMNNPLGSKSEESSRTQYLSADYAGTISAKLTSTFKSATSGGLQYYETQTLWHQGSGTGFPVRAVETITSGAAKTAQEDFFENRTFGAYAQEQLSWKDRMFLTGALRGDDNSAFGKNFDFVLYPKLSASWVASDEPFFRSNAINALKFRGAWGKSGQQPSVLAALRTYTAVTGFGGTSSVVPEAVGNPDLEPEVGRELEFGFDASLFADRLGLEFSWYNQATTNALVRVPVLPSLGFPGAQFQNIGQVSNRGLELALKSDVIQRKSISLNLNVSLSKNHNEVVDLGGKAPIIVHSGVYQVNLPGFPQATIFRKRVVSADIITVNGRRVASNVMCEGGDLVPFSLVSTGGGAPVPCAQAPNVPWGSPLPTWNASASATLTLFKNVQLYGLVEAMGGNKLMSGDIAVVHMVYGNSRAILERTDPILLGYESLGSDGTWQPGIIDAGFAKLRRISANYNLPRAWAARVNASRAVLTVSGENLMTIWVAQKESFGVRQMDPEVHQTSSAAVNDPGGLYAYNQEGIPQLRRFLTTLRLTF